MRNILKIFLGLVLSSSFSYSADIISTTELLDQAQQAIKDAFEAGSSTITPYEYYKAEAYYQIAKEEASLLNLEASKAAALKSIEWSLRAVSDRYDEGIVEDMKRLKIRKKRK